MHQVLLVTENRGIEMVNDLCYSNESACFLFINADMIFNVECFVAAVQPGGEQWSAGLEAARQRGHARRGK